MGKTRLSEKERGRVEVLSKVKAGGLTLRKAAEFLKLSYRQTRRMYRRYLSAGSAGLKHGLRDRPSNRGIAPSRRSQVLGLYQAKYGDFGPTLAVEYLGKLDGEELGVETLRQWLLGAGLWEPQRKRSSHRKWRERKTHFGEMVQMDGSRHDWFEGRRGWASLMVLIDDATNRTFAWFFEEETTAAAMTVFRDYVRRQGLPRSLYVDRDSIYETTRDSTVDEALSAQSPLTQFGRAMVELRVELILAHSPQAKGRVERRHGVFQDRLVKAMRLKAINSLESANAYLEQEFLGELNGRFTVEAASPTDMHRRLPREVKLDRVLSFQEQRVVQNDWTVSWRNRYFQLSSQHRSLRLAKRKITVLEQLDGTIELLYQGAKLSWEELKARPARKGAQSNPKPKTGATETKPAYKPAADHPWRRSSGS